MKQSQGPTNARELLEEWKTRAEVGLFAHNQAANRCGRRHLCLGGLSAVLSAVVGTAMFTAIQANQGEISRVLVGATSLLAAVTSALVTFANLTAKMDDFQRAARRYGEIRRAIEGVLADEDQVTLDAVSSVREQLDEAANASPNLPQRVFNRVRRQRRGEYTWWERAWTKFRGLPPETERRGF